MSQSDTTWADERSRNEGVNRVPKDEGSARETLRIIARLLQEQGRPRIEERWGQKCLAYPPRDMILDLIEAELGELFPDLAIEPATAAEWRKIRGRGDQHVAT